MARKAKGRKRRAKTEITPKDYRYPGESGVYWTGLGGMLILFVWIVAMFLMFARTPAKTMQWQWVYLFLWPIAAVFIANYLSAKPRYAQIKKLGPQTRVRPNNHAELHTILTRQAGILGLEKLPRMYVVDDPSAVMYSLPGRPGAVIASKAVLAALTQDEFAALLARELGSHRAHNVRVGLAITWLQSSNPLLKILFLPLFIMSVFMRGWRDIAELTADRAAILVTGNEALVNLAMVKSVIAQDPNAEVDNQDLEAYVKGSADISSDSKQLERHYRIGQFIDSQPNMKERIEQIREYRKSDQAQKAFEKLAEILKGMAGV